MPDPAAGGSAGSLWDVGQRLRAEVLGVLRQRVGLRVAPHALAGHAIEVDDVAARSVSAALRPHSWEVVDCLTVEDRRTCRYKLDLIQG